MTEFNVHMLRHWQWQMLAQAVANTATLALLYNAATCWYAAPVKAR